MRAAVLRGVEQLVLEERPIPEAKGHGVRVKVACAGICGTDLGAYRSLSLRPGTVMGHEFAGWVDAVGEEVTNCGPKDRVVVRPCSVCFQCPWCREGRISLCPGHLEDTVGLKNVAGAFADYVLVQDDQVFPIPESMTMEQAAQLEPLAVAVHAVEESGAGPDSRVLVIGAGAIGLLILQCLRDKGISELAVLEPSPFRREKAAVCGARYTAEEAVGLGAITLDWPRRGFDVVIETAGKPAAVRTALTLAAKGGQVTFVGMSPEPVVIDHFQLVTNGLRISCSIGYYTEHWQQAMDLAAQGRVDLDSMVSGEYPLERIGEAFQALLHPDRELKVLIRVYSEQGGTQS